MAFGWEGKITRLVPLEKSKHMANAVTWLNDPVITEWIVQGDFPLTRLGEEAFFDNAAKQDEASANFAIETLEGVHLGFTGILHTDWRHGFAVTGSFIGRRDFWGKGYGTDAARIRTRYAFDVLGLRVLLSEVMRGNAASIRMLEKAGYREVGCIPARFWKRGAYRDLLQMAVTREEWKVGPAARNDDVDEPAVPADDAGETDGRSEEETGA